MLKTDSIEPWISEVRACFTEAAPELLSLFEVYAEEASFGWRYISPDLERLRPGARIIEVGAGSLLLSCQLVRCGFEVTALEPIGSGFSHFEQMRDLVLQRATALGCLPVPLNVTGEALQESNRFEYAFSVNVMEHVNDVPLVIANVGRSLLVGASYRFTCPNYLFPYEPHFNIPTLVSKKLTERVFRKSIFDSGKMLDPSGTWKSLNWITVLSIKLAVSMLPWLRVRFSHLLLISTVERVKSDPLFASRRSPMVVKFLLLIVHLRLHLLLRFFPVMFHPVIDCDVRKISDPTVTHRG